MSSIISRPTTTDDDGTRTTGTIFNHAFWEDVFDKIDALFSAAMTLGSSLMVTSDLGVGVAATTANRLTVKGASATSADYGLNVTNSAGTALLQCRNDGVFITGLAPSSIYNTTVGSSANVVVEATGGVLQRQTSSLRFKTDLDPIKSERARAVLLALAPGGDAAGFTYRGIGTADDQVSRYIGWGAERVQEVEPMLVSRDAEGLPNGVAYDRVTVYLAAAWRDHEDQIEALTARVDQLTARLAAIGA